MHVKRYSYALPLCLLAVFCLVAVSAFAQAPVAGPNLFQIYAFPHAGENGFAPNGALIQDSAGNLYGTGSSGGANGFGAVFQLTPPVSPSTKWTETGLSSFAGGTADGKYPVAGLTLDSAGNLYGTTLDGGSADSGVVFEVSAPSTPGGAWNEVVLHHFAGLAGGDGGLPYAGVVFDKAGNLYGATFIGGTKSTPCPRGCGIIYQLVPPTSPATDWTENVIHIFNNGLGGGPHVTPIFDGLGHLLGTTEGGGRNNTGVVFKMTPPATSGGTWAYKMLYVFGPPSGGDGASAQGIVLHDGNIYGVTAQGGANSLGTIYELAHPPLGSSTWTESILYSFGASPTDGTFPVGSVTFDRLGNIWGVTGNGGGNGIGYCSWNGCGTVYELVPGSGSWTENLIHAFPANSKDGVAPVAGLLMGSNGVLFATASQNYGATGGIVFGVNRF